MFVKSKHQVVMVLKLRSDIPVRSAWGKSCETLRCGSTEHHRGTRLSQKNWRQEVDLGPAPWTLYFVVQCVAQYIEFVLRA